MDLSLERFRELAQTCRVIPVSRTVLADSLTPVTVAGPKVDEVGTFVLESVVGGERQGRYSFVGFRPKRMVRGGPDGFEVLDAQGNQLDRDAGPCWDRLQAWMRRHNAPVPEQLPADLPRFWGGAVGYVEYDAVHAFEPSVGQRKAVSGRSGYDFCFGVGGTVVIFDNLLQTARVVVPVMLAADEDIDAQYQAAAQEIDRTIEELSTPAQLRNFAPPTRDIDVQLPPSSFDRESYAAAVQSAREYIRDGDIFQVVLSQRFRVPARGIDPFDVYRCMRVINPSPYMYFLRMPEVVIAGASPETLVRLHNGVAEVRPIAGTRQRGVTEQEDQANEVDLLADPKERAEHVMLVDLGRNDLGRVSETGTVRLTETMAIERYSHVMHMSSNVQGKVASGHDAIDVLRATFPAGTLSGAPKVRAMQIIEEFEPEARGIYGGAVGYIGFDGSMDVAIAIRTVVKRGQEYWIQAGAGIVEASDPYKEYEETVNKARSSLVAIESARLRP